jgi:hypothetical protein
LNAFVHRRGGFASNESYYVLKSLRATPLQVLDRGGDCSDKTESGTTAADPAYDLMFPNSPWSDLASINGWIGAGTAYHPL